MDLVHDFGIYGPPGGGNRRRHPLDFMSALRSKEVWRNHIHLLVHEYYIKCLSRNPDIKLYIYTQKYIHNVPIMSGLV